MDSQTKNCNRLHYLPASWIGGNNEYHVQDGATLDVDQLLQICPAEEPTYYTAASIIPRACVRQMARKSSPRR